MKFHIFITNKEIIELKLLTLNRYKLYCCINNKQVGKNIMSRVYLLADKKEDVNYIIGVFTNKKLLFEAMENLGLKDCYIQGKTRKLNVTLSSLGFNMTDKITIYKDDENGNQDYKFKAIELRPNKFNPLMKNIFPQVNEELFG